MLDYDLVEDYEDDTETFETIIEYLRDFGDAPIKDPLDFDYDYYDDEDFFDEEEIDFFDCMDEDY